MFLCTTAVPATQITTDGLYKVKNFLYIFLLANAFLCGAAEKIPGSWTESGVLPYSYAYARTSMGHKMRKEGWECKIGFTAGRKREQEHSVWQKGEKKVQLMIWRIDSGKTGYSKGEIIVSKVDKKK